MFSHNIDGQRHLREAVVCKCDINGCGLAQTGDPTQQSIPGPGRPCQCGPVSGSADFLCLLQTLDNVPSDVDTHHVGVRVQAERHAGQGHDKGRWGDHPHVCLLMSVLSLGYQMSQGSLACVHWLTRNTTLTQEQRTENWVAARARPGQPLPLRPPDGTAWRGYWQHCALLPFLHFSFCNFN